MAGIPTTIVTRSGFEGIVANAFAGFGFNAEAPVSYIFPIEMFQVGSDLSPLEEHFDEFLGGLLTWEPQMKELGLITPDMLTVSGGDYQAFIDNTNALFMKNLWRDSLPIVPPTEELVNWILTGTDLDPDEIVSPESGILPRGGIASTRDIAVALCMAGGRPEYLALTIACVQAMAAPTSGMQSWNSTTNSVLPAFVVNGPISKQIRLGSGYGCLGADPVHPAGQTIGRAIRLVQQNLGGAVPGTGTMAIFGAMRSTNVVLAEDDDDAPEGWTTFAEDRGFSRDQNVVTFTPINGVTNIVWDFGDAQANEKCMRQMAGVMGGPSNIMRLKGPITVSPDNPDLPTGVTLLPPAFCKALAEVNGLTKQQVKDYIWENSKVEWEDIERWGRPRANTADCFQEMDRVPAAPSAKQLTLVMAGGDQGGHGNFLHVCPMGNMCSVEVQLPADWDNLILDSEIALGARPASR